MVIEDVDEACIVVDSHGVIVGTSPSCGDLLGIRPTSIGSPLTDALRLLDFATPARPLPPAGAHGIPPLAVLDTAASARGLLRIDLTGGCRTFDAVATPLVEGRTCVGSLTFVSPVGPIRLNVGHTSDPGSAPRHTRPGPQGRCA